MYEIIWGDRFEIISYGYKELIEKYIFSYFYQSRNISHELEALRYLAVLVDKSFIYFTSNKFLALSVFAE